MIFAQQQMRALRDVPLVRLARSPRAESFAFRLLAACQARGLARGRAQLKTVNS
jgi:hypothetical protein